MLKDLIAINNFLSIILLAKSVVKDSGISMTFHRNIPHHCSTSHCYRPPTELRRLCFHTCLSVSHSVYGGGVPCDHYLWRIGLHCTYTSPPLKICSNLFTWRQPFPPVRTLVATTEPRTAGKWVIYILETRIGGNIWADPSLGRQHTMLDTPL